MLKMMLSKPGFYRLSWLLTAACACNFQSGPAARQETAAEMPPAQSPAPGKDYVEFERVKIMDRQAFSQPAEAYSLLLPEGWSSDGGVFWTAPGNTCAGTNLQFSAGSPDGKMTFAVLPVIIWSWSNNAQALQMSRQYNTSQYCTVEQPLDAEQYLKGRWIRDLNQASVTDVRANPEVVQAMGKEDQRHRAELIRYGASQVNFRHTAITARLKWDNGTAGIVLCGVTNGETYIPNVYNGAYDISYTSYATRMLFTFPESETAAAEKMMTVIVGSFRTNPEWKKATDDFWRAVREKKQIQHLGTIRLIDERTRQIGEQAIENGNRRLADMDRQMRSWEARQSARDKTHTDFIKTIREVENYRDEEGKFEMSAGYDHAWSRNDGTRFLMTNDPNFDPSSVFQDQRWKEMKKVD